MDIQELWTNIQGEFGKVNGRLDNLETDMKDVKGEVVTINGRLDNVETDVKDMKRQFIKMDNRLGIVETQVKEIKYQNGEIKEEVENISKKLDSMQNSNIANILINQNKLFKIIKRETEINKKEHEEFRENFRMLNIF